METNQNLSKKTNKIKLDFKDSKYATDEEKDLLQKFGLKRDLVKFMLMDKAMKLTLKEIHIKCRY